MTRPAHVPLTAVLLIVIASACFTVIDVSVKHLSQRYPVPLLVWARWSVQALLMLALLGPKLRWKLIRTSRPALQLTRGVLLIASSVCFFFGLKYLPLAEATALNYMSPILVTLMAGWFLSERLTQPRWAFVVAGLVGMLLIVRPGSDVLTPAALFSLGAALLYATFQILTRKLAGEDLMVLLMYPALVGAVVLSAPVPFMHDTTWYPIRDIIMFLGMGIMGFLGHLLFIRAFQLASASALAPFTYMQLVWSTLAGWLVFGSLPDAWAFCGIVVIAGSGVVLTWYERWRASLPQSEPAAVD
ncbi:MAG TPA: DMT family transporter [Casimicrobiaceae bacterium]|nr:DMT family transporter [Casimicrobiaceae bacterium]